MNTQMSKQAGFTLIELVMVIVILGILAATAMPKFVNLSGQATQAAVDGIAGGLGSGSAVNFAARSANAANGVAVANCTDVANTLSGGLDTDYTITAAAVAAGATVVCTVTHTASTLTATFTAHGIL